MTIGEKIYTLRTKCGMTQEQLAEKMGVSRQAISKWESDVSIPEINKLKALANLFQVSLDEMMDEKPLIEKVTQVQNPNETEKAKNDDKQIKEIKKSQRILAIIAMALGVAMIIQAFSIINLSEELHYLQAEISRVSSMSSYNQSTPESEEYLFQEYNYHLGEINEETKTIKFSFECIPKQFSETTRIIVSHEADNGEVYDMELDGDNGIYKGEMDLPICMINKSLLILEDENVRNVEVVYGLVDAIREVYPNFCVRVPSKNKIKEVEISLVPGETEILNENSKKLEKVTLQLHGGTNSTPYELIWEKTFTQDEMKQLIDEQTVKISVEMQGEMEPDYVLAKVIFEHALLEGEQVCESVSVGMDEYKVSTHAALYMYYDYSFSNFESKIN